MYTNLHVHVLVISISNYMYMYPIYMYPVLIFNAFYFIHAVSILYPVVSAQYVCM